MILDTLIVGGTVYDGISTSSREISVGIKDGAIRLDIDAHTEAKHRIDASGCIVCPGFIDPHASTGFGFFFPRAADHKLYQGITTEIFGNCGTSPGPVGERLIPTMEKLSKEIGFPFEWKSLEEYFHAIEGKIAFNAATLIGHSTLRGGYVKEWTKPTRTEIDAMKSALAQAMKEGALGMSTGLIYAPGCFAEVEEIVELAKVTAAHGGVYASHVRDERNDLLPAVDEALHIAKEAKIPTLISHLKAAEQPNWGKVELVLQKIRDFRAAFPYTPVGFDVYPYTAISTKLRAFIPKQFLENGVEAMSAQLQNEETSQIIQDWVEERSYDLKEMLLLSGSSQVQGKQIAQVMEERNTPAGETIRQILLEEPDTWMVYHCISQEDVDKAVCFPDSMICTDSWSYPINAPKSIGRPHPRSYGAFTTYLERYVKDLKVLDWGTAIRKVSHFPAVFFGLEKRGSLTQDYRADILVFDPKKIKAKATYQDPKQYSEGMQYVFVEGEPVLQNEQVVDILPGKILKKLRE